MGTDRCTVYHDRVYVISVGDSLHDPIPMTGIAPAVKTVVDGCRRAISLRQISPGKAGAQNIENTVEHAPVIDPLLTSSIVRKDRLDCWMSFKSDPGNVAEI